MHYFATVCITTSFGVCIGLLLAHLRPLDAHVEALDPQRLRGLIQFHDPAAGLSDQTFWNASDGIRGVKLRLGQMLRLLAILQAGVKRNLIKPDEAKECWKSAALQVLYSARAAPEAVICRLSPRLPHLNALFALRAHVQLTYDVTMFCRMSGLLECVFDGRDLL